MHTRKQSNLRNIMLIVLCMVSHSIGAVTFVVNNNLDPGSGGCNANECTLREAITAANATTTPDVINFSFRPDFRSEGSDPGVITEVLIQPTTAMPTITQSLKINGYSVAGSVANTNALVSNARLRIRVDGARMQSGTGNIGFAVCGNDVTIRGLSITRFGNVGIAFGRTNTAAPCPVVPANGFVHGNFIGLATDGTTAAGNGNSGIASREVPIQIGSASIQDRNIVASTSGFGITLNRAGASGSSVLGNLIGTDRTGTLDRGNGAGGIDLGFENASGITVGSVSAPNRIAFNGTGVQVKTTLNNRLFANHYASNDGLAIDLFGAADESGVSLNDIGDGDDGGNGQQNYLNNGFTAQRTDTGINIQGTLRRIATSTPLTFTIAAYASASCDVSGHGEGEQFLGTATASTTTGNAPINVEIRLATQPTFGSVITTTVTSPGGSTSEFSSCAQLDPPPLVVNNLDDSDDGSCNSEHCSLRDAIIAANASPAGDVIRFNITAPASGELMIQPRSPLPTITAPVAIDGYSQSGTAVNTDPDVSNAVLRIRVDGQNLVGSNLIKICANNTTIRGLSITRANSNTGRGISVCNALTNGVSIQGNFIGLQTDGSTEAGNTNGVFSDSRITIGGTAVADRNVFGGNAEIGIGLQQQSGSLVVGNLIGTDRTGMLARQQSHGIKIGSGITNLQVGNEAAPNLIRFNRIGISTSTSATTNANQWQHNRIFDNINLGIDLGETGVTPNDLNDTDSGVNGLQNFPIISKAERNAAGILITGELDVPVSTSNVPYAIAVYASASCDSSGNGEGQFLLGSATVNLTHPSGEGFQILVESNVDLDANVQITTTATGPQGSSEFSACVTASDAPPGIVVDSILDIGGTVGGCTQVGDSNECTLREAIALANSRVGADTIRFELTDNGPFVIFIDSLLPAINEALLVDGYSQLGTSPNSAETGSDANIEIQLRNGGGVSVGLMICSSDVTIRGLSISQFDLASIATKTNASNSCAVNGTNVRIQGNFIGVLDNGIGVINNLGVLVKNTVVTIGGGKLSDRNIISSNASQGVLIAGAASSGSVVLNNIIGAGTSVMDNLGNGGAGVEINNASNVTVGDEGILANLIAFNGSGVLMLGAGTGNRAYANEFLSNDGLGIDLSAAAGANGVTANDLNDADSGPNNLQNFPVLSDGSATWASITINGILDVPAGILSPLRYTLAFYESTTCNISGNGQGTTYLGSQSVAFASNGENFSVTLPIAPANGATAITATATDPDGNTSEFSNCLVGPRPELLFADSFE